MNLYDYHARNYDPAIGRWMNIDPLADDIMQVDLSPYSFSWNNPVNINDPDGQCPWCIGALVGAFVDYGLQVATNYAQGKTGSEAWLDVDITSIAISAAGGAASGGLSSVKNISTVTSVVSQVGISTAENAAHQLNDTGTINGAKLATDVVVSTVMNNSLGDIRVAENVSPNTIRNAERRLDRAERVNRNSSPSRQQAVIEARSDLNNLNSRDRTVNAVNQAAGQVVSSSATDLITNNSNSLRTNIAVVDERTMNTQARDNTRVVIRRTSN